ncbi:MAG: type II toxin-antitoxin system VapC family toxin [Blastocatellia bacterium]|nr:type II toxin-antitoxin system VapC family toxin [Blastocatellia bacterium]
MSTTVSPAVVADTHTLIWSLFEPSRLSVAAKTALVDAETAGAPIYVSSVSIVELRYLVDKGKFAETDYDAVLNVLRDPATAPTVVPLDTDNADALKLIARADVPDMPDRIIAATARYLGLPLVTRDSMIQSSGIPTIW